MKRWLYVVAGAAILFGLIGWRVVSKSRDAAELKTSQQKRLQAPVRVVLDTAGPREITQHLEAVGSLESPYSVKLSPKVAGRIDYLQVREGDAVTPGMQLIRIDPTAVEAEVLQAQAALAEARSRYTQALLTQNPNDVGVKTQIRQQQAANSSAEADFKQASENYASQVAAADSGVVDADAKVAGAKSGIKSAEADLNGAKANLDNAKSKFNRVNDLYHKGYIAAQDVDDARTTVSVQESQYGSSQSRLAVAKSALDSAVAQQKAAQNQASIVKKKGVADIEASRAKLTQAGASLDLAKSNTAQTAAYKANLAALKSGVAVAEAQLGQAIAHRADTVLTSPIKGSVTARAADPGSIVTAGQPILTIQYLDWLYVTASLPVEDSGQVHIGQDADVIIDALPGQKFEGMISQINPSADPTSRQFTLQLKLMNPDHKLRAGMYARVQIVTERTPAAVVVPREAVTAQDGNSVVRVVDAQNVVHVRSVKLGPSDDKGVQVLEGVEAGDKVVVLSYAPVRDGQTVTAGKGAAK